MVRYENRWYRATCVEVCYDGHATVQFIDYDNMQIIDIYNVRPLPTCLRFEILTINAVCFPEILNISTEIRKRMANGELDPEEVKKQYQELEQKQKQLEQKYSELSRWKILQMDQRTQNGEFDKKYDAFYATLQEL